MVVRNWPYSDLYVAKPNVPNVITKRSSAIGPVRVRRTDGPSVPSGVEITEKARNDASWSREARRRNTPQARTRYSPLTLRL